MVHTDEFTAILLRTPAEAATRKSFSDERSASPVGQVPRSPLPRKWPLSYSFFRGAHTHFLPPLSGRSPVNRLSECGLGTHRARIPKFREVSETNLLPRLLNAESFNAILATGIHAL